MQNILVDTIKENNKNILVDMIKQQSSTQIKYFCLHLHKIQHNSNFVGRNDVI